MCNSTNLHEKIDCLLFLNDLATSSQQQPNSLLLFHEKTPKIIMTFLITLREILLETTQFLHFFLNNLQKFLASGLLDMSNNCLIWLVEEILFILVRNENKNITKLLNLCLVRILEFGDIKVVMLGVWSLFMKYERFPCYSLILSLINLAILKILKRIHNKDFPFLELMFEINRFLRQSKRIAINQAQNEDLSFRTVKCVVYQLIQVKELEIIKFMEEIKDLSDVLLRYFDYLFIN